MKGRAYNAALLLVDKETLRGQPCAVVSKSPSTDLAGIFTLSAVTTDNPFPDYVIVICQLFLEQLITFLIANNVLLSLLKLCWRFL